MPDAPMPQQPPGGQGGAPQGGAPAQQQGGGGIAQQLAALDGALYKLSQFVSQQPQLSKDLKSAAQDALNAFRTFEKLLVQSAGGDGGEPDEDDQDAGATTPQQGGSAGAVPMTHQNMRGQ